MRSGEPPRPRDIETERDGIGAERKVGEVKVTLSGVVQKLVPGVGLERAQIEVRGADDLYRELRIANALKDTEGNEVKLAPGMEVEIVIKVRPGSGTEKTAG